MMKNGVKSFKFGFMAGLALLAFGCSDGGSYDQGPTAIADGRVAQGAVKSAKVCADMNFNNKCDDGEPFTITSASPAFAGRYIVRNIPENTPYQFVTEGGTDSLTNMPARSLRALKGSRNITPITTTVATLSTPVEQAALVKMLDTLSGGQGYDIDISSEPMPPLFFAVVKATEQTLAKLAEVGLSSQDDQAVILNAIAEQLLAKPLTASENTLEEVFAAAATQIAASTTSADFQVTNPAIFATELGTMAKDIEVVINNAVNQDGVVMEDSTLQDAIEAVPDPVLPVGSVTLSAETISIFNNASSLQDRADVATDKTLSVTAGGFSSALVIVKGSNNLTPAVAQTYPDATFSLVVTDKNSNRSLQVVVMGVDVAVTAAGGVTLSGGTVLELRGINSDASMVVDKSFSTVGTFVTFNGSTLTLNIDALQAAVEAVDGSVDEVGSYDVFVEFDGAPGVPVAVALTVN